MHCNAADARHVDSPKFVGRGVPMVLSIIGVGQGIVQLLHAVDTKPLGTCYGFATIWTLNFGSPNLGEGVPIRWRALMMSGRASLRRKLSVAFFPQF